MITTTETIDDATIPAPEETAKEAFDSFFEHKDAARAAYQIAEALGILNAVNYNANHSSLNVVHGGDNARVLHFRVSGLPSRVLKKVQNDLIPALHKHTNSRYGRSSIHTPDYSTKDHFGRLRERVQIFQDAVYAPAYANVV